MRRVALGLYRKYGFRRTKLSFVTLLTPLDNHPVDGRPNRKTVHARFSSPRTFLPQDRLAVPPPSPSLGLLLPAHFIRLSTLPNEGYCSQGADSCYRVIFFSFCRYGRCPLATDFFSPAWAWLLWPILGSDLSSPLFFPVYAPCLNSHVSVD